MGSYTRRTAEVCAAFLLPRLRPDSEILNVGCGPGTVTAGLARRSGRVMGLDMSAEMVEEARRHAADCGLDNASFQVGSAYDLPWDDDSFDVVYAHQVLQHLPDPVRALREARRVLRPGGLVAVRDSDYGTMLHAPVFPAIERWRDLYHQVATANGGEPGAHLHLYRRGVTDDPGVDQRDIVPVDVVGGQGHSAAVPQAWEVHYHTDALGRNCHSPPCSQAMKQNMLVSNAGAQGSSQEAVDATTAQSQPSETESPENDYGPNFPVSPIPAVNVASVPQRSPLRYPGGKTWLIPHIRAWLAPIQPRPRVLLESFCGGGTVALTAVCEGLLEQSIMAEFDRDVAAFWHAALRHNAELCDLVSEFESDTRSCFYLGQSSTAELA